MDAVTFIDLPELTNNFIHYDPESSHELFKNVKYVTYIDKRKILLYYLDDSYKVLTRFDDSEYYIPKLNYYTYGGVAGPIFDFMYKSIENGKIIVPDFRFDINKHVIVGDYYF